jgi:serine/threonine protein kinase
MYWFAVEYMEYGSLHDLLRNDTMYLSGEIILQICRDVAQGLRFLHQSKPPILHGDMKARNILVDARFRAKLCDFGLSNKRSNTITGTPYWLAPEYLRGQSQYNAQCDIYSIGIILYEIYSREDPYQGEDFRDTLRKICDRRVNKRPAVPATCPPKMAETMKKCWSPDPFSRPQAKDLDTTFLDYNMRDAEPIEPEEAEGRERPTGDKLYELFPKNVADQLKAGQKVEPEQHEEVTVGKSCCNCSHHIYQSHTDKYTHLLLFIPFVAVHSL